VTCRKAWYLFSLALLPVLILAAGCKSTSSSQPEKPPQAVSLQGVRVLMVIAPGDFNDTELQVPLERLKSEGAAVDVASKVKEQLTGMHGLKFTPDLTLDEVDLSRYECVIFVGGAGTKVYFDDPQVLQLAKDAVAQGKLVGAICLAPSILARAGLLEGKNATVWKSEKDTLIAHGAHYGGPGVVDAGNIITASGPDQAKRFAAQVTAALKHRQLLRQAK